MRGVPLAGEALGFSNLFGGHFGGVDVSVLDPPVAILARRLGGGEVGPHVRFDVVLRDAEFGFCKFLVHTALDIFRFIEVRDRAPEFFRHIRRHLTSRRTQTTTPCFNPRPPAEDDMSAATMPCCAKCFNPRPPRGGRLTISSDAVTVTQFQSAPPRGGRHYELIADCIQKVSIRAHVE